MQLNATKKLNLLKKLVIMNKKPEELLKGFDETFYLTLSLIRDPPVPQKTKQQQQQQLHFKTGMFSAHK